MTLAAFRRAFHAAALTAAALLFSHAMQGQSRTQPKAHTPAKSPTKQGAFYIHRYRNLFVEDGHPAAEVQRRLDAAFQQMFHGDPKTEALYFAAGQNADGPLAYITDWANHDVRSEGMSYGMMIAVQLNHKPEFDALWNWAHTYMLVKDPAHPSVGFFSWSCKLDGTPNEETPAPDGEEYYAMALLFASARWGDGAGIYNYHAAANDILHAMLHREEITGPTRFGNRTVSAMFDPTHKMVRFTPSGGGRDFTDPSYHLPAFYELWARFGPPEDRAFWLEAARTSRAFFVASANPSTGLTPAYANFDGSPRETRFGQSTLFGFDSWRTASNWSVDYAWFAADANEPILSDRIEAFFTSKGPNYPAIYTVDGKPLPPPADADHAPDYGHSTGLVATNAVTALAATDHTRAQAFTEALWKEPLPTGQFRYYNGMLWILSYMHASGNFRIYEPKRLNAAAPATTPGRQNKH